ncbi:hypothetical protein HMPREF0645_0192, partial [Hallella bergensis DSM 17361]
MTSRRNFIKQIYEATTLYYQPFIPDSTCFCSMWLKGTHRLLGTRQTKG